MADPLPNWNEGRSRNDIVNFVQRVTGQYPAGQRGDR
jgi:hypothetical protein